MYCIVKINIDYQFSGLILTYKITLMKKVPLAFILYATGLILLYLTFSLKGAIPYLCLGGAVICFLAASHWTRPGKESDEDPAVTRIRFMNK